jgi:hypothetical protein
MIFRILEEQFAQRTKGSKAADQRFMQLALTLGRRGQGRTWPNPAVGAVVVNDGVIVGRKQAAVRTPKPWRLRMPAKPPAVPRST